MPCAFGHVDHVQGDDDRHAQFEHLRRQVEVAFEVGGIDDGDDDVGPGFAGCWPRITSTATISSGLRGARL